jgi:hypothetical protein
MRALDEVMAEIDRLHDEDPAQRELAYAERLSRWLAKLDANPDALLRIAVRAQHLKRWERPRADYPAGRTGYLRWRRDAARHHATLVADVMCRYGFVDADIERVTALVRKEGVGHDRDAQTLEDCACLAFLESELAGFAAKHPAAKVQEILEKTGRKMSHRARELARELVPKGPTIAE